jgi:hypothetical protein
MNRNINLAQVMMRVFTMSSATTFARTFIGKTMAPNGAWLNLEAKDWLVFCYLGPLCLRGFFEPNEKFLR